MKLSQTNRETALAQAAARQAIEDLQARTFDELFVLFNTPTLDDPTGKFAPGNAFDVPGLAPRADDLDGLVGQVILPEKSPLGVSGLYENYSDAVMGMPRDLNGDGDIDDLNHAGDYQILPVRVRLEWTGKGGERMLEVHTIVSAR